MTSCARHLLFIDTSLYELFPFHGFRLSANLRHAAGFGIVVQE